jgi:hypothetical protein
VGRGRGVGLTPLSSAKMRFDVLPKRFMAKGSVTLPKVLAATAVHAMPGTAVGDGMLSDVAHGSGE